MANEITVSAALQIEKGNLSMTVPSSRQQIDMTGTRASHALQTIGTTYEAISAGDITSAGWCRILNIDSTNYVEIGLEVSSTFYPMFKLLPGHWVQGPLSVLTLFAKANTAACDILVTLVEA